MKLLQGIFIFFGLSIIILSIIGLMTAPTEQAYIGVGGLLAGWFVLGVSPIFGIETSGL